MLKRIKNDYIGWLVLIGSAVLLLEILFFNKGLIFLLLLSAGMIYIGRKKSRKKKGKVLFWGGIILFLSSLFNMLTFKFLIAAKLIHQIIQFGKSKRSPRKIAPVVMEAKEEKQDEPILKSKPLMENVLFGQQKTSNHVYEWNDVNIQAGIGDTMIDLSYTVFPKGETVIFIRNIIGNIRILIPYEIEVSIHHSVLAGSVDFLEFQGEKNFNQVYHLKTPGYEKAEQKVKIFTSLVVGNIEVSRI